MERRGISPVVATVLLIAIVVVIAMIVFMWIRGISDEAITKFDGTNVKLICEEVSFDADFYSGRLSISNLADVPIFRMKVRVEGSGSYQTFELNENWPDTGLLQGGTYDGPITEPGTKIILTPVLLGTTSQNEEKSYTCEDRHSVEIEMS